MPRQKRADEAGVIYHAINRGNARQKIFLKQDDYDAFIRVLAEGLEKYPVELFSFALMPNHWHLVLRPQQNGQMGRLLRWVTATHSLRYHGHYRTRGEGHLYQSRFKSFPVQDDTHFYVLCRYVERNPLRANLVKHAEDWQYGSLFRWNQSAEPLPKILSRWPIPRLPNWVQRVNEPLGKKELDAIRTCVNRGRPFGDEQWTDEVAEKHGLWFTMRPVGRPRKKRTPTK
ncbi:transposase [Stieleria varia]|uniref:Transposase IS200 like protein n=1 Tax=Stieleria varia TaxID=2528005 RepID=A0A5C6B8L2_9BACT|nr:transposase [Stieleria varia]TWU07586.1 Transposase IS200 like protein [Stieleria varia]